MCARPIVPRPETLRAYPVRDPRIDWSLEPEGEGGATVAELRIPRRQDRLARLLNRLFEAPPHRVVRLDELGTQVWQLCDGAHTVEDVVRDLAERHGLERPEVEQRLAVYLHTLLRRGYVALRPAAESEKECSGGVE